MNARLIDGKFGEGLETVVQLVRHEDFTVELADAIRRPGGVKLALGALNAAFFPPVPAGIPQTAAEEEQELYVLPIQDADVPAEHQDTVRKYRALAKEWGVPDVHAVCYLVREGFALKLHAAKAGPCYRDFNDLQSWNFQDDPTQGCLMFWIPRVVPGSLEKNLEHQRRLLGKIAKKAKLPNGHLQNLGSVALDA
ncbi:MAG: hypothetical protein Q8P20_04805, partial [bacterium]|nr:hypothetical protein [bacterium]